MGSARPLMMLAFVTAFAACSTTAIPLGADRMNDRGDAVVVIDDAAITVDTTFSPGHDDATMMWVRRAGTMVRQYFGRFSVPELDIDVVTAGVSGVSFGIHYSGQRLRIFRGLVCTDEQLEQDWVLLHEMLHTAYPMVDDDHKWMREGLSTYLETVVRAQAGVIDDQSVWSHFVAHMPQGLPAGSKGLVDSHSWANLYWGGALFWLLADVRIREQTAGRDTPMSLQDSLRAILAAGGNARWVWKIDRILDVGDDATGTTVLHDLYQEMALAPIVIDLDALWLKLGVRDRSETLTFSSDAPLADLRRAMTQQRHTLRSISAK